MKVLITSDIHIHDFNANRLFGDSRFRLNQFDRLSDRLVQIIEQEQVQAMCIAGDFLHVASPRPYVVNAAGRFLKKIARLVPIYVTHGQHDFDSRTAMSEDNSLLSLFNNIDNVFYLHKDSVRLGDKDFYFQGWTPEQDFSAVQAGRYDVLVGHATINSAVMNEYGSTATGPEFEANKFELCFMGDIHYPQVKDNQVIPGVPIQNNPGDSPSNSVIIFETTDMTWKRVKTETANHRFLKFVISDTVSEDPYIITRSRKTKKNVLQEENLTKSVDINEVIDKYVTLEGLTDVHAQMHAIVSKLPQETLNLNFSLTDLSVKNFGSVGELKWSPSFGINLIIGNNGTGKSTLVDAVRFALLGSNAPRELVRIGQTEMEVLLSLVYDSCDYTIVRGFSNKSSYLKYYQNNKEVELENQKAGNARIKSDLPFIDFYKHLHRDQDNLRFLGSQSYSERVEMISQVVGLSQIARYEKAAQDSRSPIVKEFDLASRSLETVTAYLKSVEALNLDIDLPDDIDDKIKAATLLLSQMNMLKDLERKFDVESNEVRKLEYALSQISPTALDETDYSGTYAQVTRDLAEKTKYLRQLETNLSSYQMEYSAAKNSIKRLEESMVSLDNNLSSLKKRECPTCHQDVDAHLTQKISYDISTNRSRLNDEVLKIKQRTRDVVEFINNAQTEKTEYLSTIDTLRNEYNRLSVLASKQEEQRKVQLRYDAISKSMIEIGPKKDDTNKRLGMIRLAVGKKLGLTVESPEDTSKVIIDLTSNISTFNYQKETIRKTEALKTAILQKKGEATELTHKVASLSDEVSKYDKYIMLMSSKGQINRSILTTISDNLSNEKIKVIAFKTLTSGETRPDFNLYLNVAGTFINYDKLSGGQKTVCDTFIMKNLIDLAGGAGLLIFDETFSQVDPANLEYVVDTVKQLNASHTFIVSHTENFPYYDNLLSTNFSETGVTTYNLPYSGNK